MMNQKIFQNTFSKVRLSDHKKDDLLQLKKGRKKKIFYMTKMAAAIALCVVSLLGATVSYAVSDGKVFNSIGNWLSAKVLVNGEKHNATIEKNNQDNFVLSYGGAEDHFTMEIDGSKDTSLMVLEVEYGENGDENTTIHSIEVDTAKSHEEQVWSIRQQMLPLTQEQSASEITDNYISKLQKSVSKLAGVWKEGVSLSIKDLKKIKLGHKIAIEDYDYKRILGEDGKETSWLYIDYTDVCLDKKGRAEFTQMSDAGYRTMFRIKLDSGEVREYAPA